MRLRTGVGLPVAPLAGTVSPPKLFRHHRSRSPTIQEVRVTAVALVAAWHSSALVFVCVGESLSWQQVTVIEAPRSAALVDPAPPARIPTQATLPVNRSNPSRTASKRPRAPPGQSRDGSAPSRSCYGRPDRRRRITMPASLRNASVLPCIAVALYRKARDQDDFGQRAVASVILQRAALPNRWGGTACDIVEPGRSPFSHRAMTIRRSTT